jgi:hypothetical protein
LVTYPKVCPVYWTRDNGPKGLLIPHVVLEVRGSRTKGVRKDFALGGACVPSASW